MTTFASPLTTSPSVSRLATLAWIATAMACGSEGASDPLEHAGGKADGATTLAGLPADLAPWGGDDPARWSPEAIIANAVTAELARDPGARVSVPAALWTSQYAPFGDGQTNAAVSMAYWTAHRPPVLATRRDSRITVRFDRALPLSGDVFEVWSADGAWIRSVPGGRTDHGDWVVELGELPPALLDRLVVSPRGWADGFPLAFDVPVTSVQALASSLPAPHRQLPGGEPVVDPVAARLAAADPTTSVFDVLRASSFPAGFVNQQPYASDDVHAAFPQPGAPRVTAVGGAATWVAEQPFKNLYVCFDRRRPERERTYGVPSGAGWHRIGAPAEAILASLEDSALLVGHARDGRLTPPPGGQFAYGLDRATTFALLQPGQAFTTTRDDFHWYAVHQPTEPCVQVWVQP